ncbi:hypothetical protein O3P69_003167 [Scylla paramamosain]|uniref:Uncharacterized protein n=1 Tax=Scylla paramamosain TaxID=85552 RepID=A0AAW0UJG5_SCYPA
MSVVNQEAHSLKQELVRRRCAETIAVVICVKAWAPVTHHSGPVKCALSPQCKTWKGFCFEKTNSDACINGDVSKDGLKCAPSPQCKAWKGFCFEKTNPDACTNGDVSKDGCEGSECACCMPRPVKCAPSQQCKAWKGFCFEKTNPEVCTNGDVSKDGCEGSECACCMPRINL